MIIAFVLAATAAAVFCALYLFSRKSAEKQIKQLREELEKNETKLKKEQEKSTAKEGKRIAGDFFYQLETIRLLASLSEEETHRVKEKQVEIVEICKEMMEKLR